MPVISFANMKGGVGKTTLAVNVAYCLSQRMNKKVLLIDIDPQFNATQCFLSGEQYIKVLQSGQNTIYHLFRQDKDDMIPNVVTGEKLTLGINRDKLIYKFSEKIDLVLGDLNLYRIEAAPGMAYERLLKNFLERDKLIETYDYVLIDCPPTPSIWMISGLLASSHYLIPIKPEPLSTYGIDIFSGVVNRVVQNHGHDIKCAGVLLTMSEGNTLVYKDTIDMLNNNERWQDKVFTYELEKRTAISRQQKKQKFMLDEAKTKQIIVNITQEFIGRVS